MGGGDDLPGVAEDITPEAQELLELLLQHLLRTPVVSPPKATPIPSELEEFASGRAAYAGAATRGGERRNRPTVVCFSCGESGHAASWCPTLDETFPFLQPERVVTPDGG